MPAFFCSRHLVRLGILLPGLWLSGCQSTALFNPTEPDTPSPSAEQTALREITPPISGLDGEAVSELLAAEIAGQRNRIDLALQIYLEQASRLQQPELARRAAYISQYAGDSQATLEAAALWSDTDPENAESRRISSTLLIQQGDYLAALAVQEELLALEEPTHLSYLATQSAESAPETRQALHLNLQDLLIIYPEYPDLLTAIAQMEYFAGDYETALTHVQKALTQAPENIHSLLLKADLMIATQGAEAGVQLLQQAVKQQPDNLRLQLALARALVKQGDIGAAQEVFASMSSNHPENSQLTLSLALILMENGLADAAETELLSLLEQEEETNAAHYYLGRIKEQNGNTEAAIKHYRSVTGGKDFLQAQARAARLFIETGDIAAARKHLQQMRGQLPEHKVKLYLIESDILQSLEQTDAAYRLLTEAIQSEGSDYELLYSRAMLSLQQGHIDAMEQDLREILQHEPNNAMVLNTLGYTLTEYSERYSEALLLIRKAAALKPGDPAITDSLGWVYFKLGQYHKAIHYLNQAYDQLQDPEVASHLIEVYWVAQKPQAAIDLLLDARQRFPEHPLLHDLERRIPELSIAADKQQQTEQDGQAAPDPSATE